jgi:O-antigen/teichoic acid export membrane protein
MLNEKLTKSIKQNLSGNVGLYLVQFIGLMIFSRIFTPQDFGLFATFSVITYFFQIVSDFGIGPALINKKEVSVTERNGLFTFTIILSLIFSFLCYFFVSEIGQLMNVVLVDYLSLLIIVVLFNSMSVVPIALLQKDLLFLKIAKINIFAELISIIICLISYSNGGGVYSLLMKPAIFAIFKFIIVYVESLKTKLGKLRIEFEFGILKEIYSFSSFQFLSTFLNYISTNIDKILISKYLGLEVLGFYDRANQIIRYPLVLFSFSLNQTIQPVLADGRRDAKFIYSIFQALTSRLLSFTILISVFVSFNAQQIIYVLLGSDWLELTEIVEVFALLIPLRVLVSISGAFFQVLDNTRLMLFSSILGLIVLFTVVYLGVKTNDLRELSFYIIVGAVINLLQAYFILVKICFDEICYKYFLNLSWSVRGSIIASVIYYVMHILTKDHVFLYVSVSFFTLLINLCFALLALFFTIKVIKIGI